MVVLAGARKGPALRFFLDTAQRGRNLPVSPKRFAEGSIMIRRDDLRPLITSSVAQIARSQLLIKKLKRLMDKSQKIIDDETAKQFEQASAQRKRKRPPRS
jgi:hypothetical protein